MQGLNGHGHEPDPSALLGAAFCCGFCLGHLVSLDVTEGHRLLCPLRCLKTLAWDYRHVSQDIQTWGGVPLLSASAGAMYFAFLGTMHFLEATRAGLGPTRATPRMWLEWQLLCFLVVPLSIECRGDG